LLLDVTPPSLGIETMGADQDDQEEHAPFRTVQTFDGVEE
jgi:hypothetical protein